MEFTFVLEDKRRKRNKEKQETRKKVIKMDEVNDLLSWRRWRKDNWILNLGEEDNGEDDVN